MKIVYIYKDNNKYVICHLQQQQICDVSFARHS